MSRLTIEASTPLCLLQDAGRFGVRHLGVTQGGAADWLSMAWANWLLDNPLDAPVVEITLGGFTLQPSEFMKPALIVLVSWMFSEGQKGQGVPGVSIAFGLYFLSVGLLLIQLAQQAGHAQRASFVLQTQAIA